eukprot:1981134-Alexandrium_andersonii.AAC.1
MKYSTNPAPEPWWPKPNIFTEGLNVGATTINLNEDMRTRSLGKEGGQAVNVGNEPGGPHG